MTQVVEPITASDTVSITLPRKLAATLVHHSPAVVDWMHHLLERNTDGLLNPTEQAELEALVELAQVKQLLATALDNGTAA